MDGGDGGGEGEREAESGEEGSGAEERDGVHSRLVPHVAGLDARGGDTRHRLEVVDVCDARVGGDCESEG